MVSNSPHADRVLVGLSGGVDSAVCVRILQQQGFSVLGLVIAFSPAHATAVKAAEKAAEELGIPLEVYHCEPEFEQEVILPFCRAYAGGETPNPCIFCNPAVKFKILAQRAEERGIRYIATGHYARVKEQNGYFYVARAASANRDQSYMLYRLPQDVLKHLCLPVGEFTKEDIREMAREYGLSSADSPDSQEICFIPDNDYGSYIEKRGFMAKHGCFIAPNGTNLGPHKGVLHYTVGQRRGLGIALGKPVFVKEILQSGDIQLGWGGEEFSACITLRDVCITDGRKLQKGDYFTVKVRSMALPVGCNIDYDTSNQLVLRFETPQRAPAPGQSAVLYEDDIVVGGGYINSAG